MQHAVETIRRWVGAKIPPETIALFTRNKGDHLTTLAHALQEGRLRGAGLDVLSTEPPPTTHPLLSAPRCLITPHLAWGTTAARTRLMGVVTSNVLAFLAGNGVNRVV